LAAVGAQLALGRKALWPPPEEVLYVAPVLIVVLIASFWLAPDSASAVRIVVAGGLACLWAQGAFLRARPAGVVRRAATSVLGLAQAAVLVYSAVVVNHLWLKLVTTLSGAAE